MRINLRHVASAAILAAAAVSVLGPVPAQASPHTAPTTASIPMAQPYPFPHYGCSRLPSTPATANVVNVVCTERAARLSSRMRAWAQCRRILIRRGPTTYPPYSYTAYGAWVGPKEVLSYFPPGHQFRFTPSVACGRGSFVTNWGTNSMW